MKVGTVRYNIKTGKMTFNGQPLADPDLHVLAEACRAAQKGRR